MSISNACRTFLLHIDAIKHYDTFIQIADSSEAFKQKVATFDQWCSTLNISEINKEFLFDLMLVVHFENQQQFENFLDSPEWQDVEDYSVERGSELLNILLYLIEATDENVEISIDDFLYEFLLIEDDEFQDEHRIYEDLIDNADLTECGQDEIVAVFPSVPDTELAEILRPLLLFFSSPYTQVDASKLTQTEQAIYHTFMALTSKK